MRRRQVLLGTTAVVAGLAGCSGSNETGTVPPTETASSTPVPAPTETATPTETETATPAETPTPHPETPPADFDPAWLFDEEDDWTELERLTETLDSEEGYDGTPAYARTAEYAHVPAWEEFQAVTDTNEVPPPGCAVLSKWALPREFSDTSVDLVAEAEDWFATKFEECPVSVEGPEYTHSVSAELDSGRTVGYDPYHAEGDTGRFANPIEMTVRGMDVEVQQITYDARAVLLALLGPESRVGYLVGGGWPTDNTVKLHTGEYTYTEVRAEVSERRWNYEEDLFEVLNEIEQQ